MTIQTPGAPHGAAAHAMGAAGGRRCMLALVLPCQATSSAAGRRLAWVRFSNTPRPAELGAGWVQALRSGLAWDGSPQEPLFIRGRHLAAKTKQPHLRMGCGQKGSRHHAARLRSLRLCRCEAPCPQPCSTRQDRCIQQEAMLRTVQAFPSIGTMPPPRRQ